MIPTAGNVLLFAAMVATGVLAAAGWVAGHRRSPGAADLARQAAWIAAILLSGATLLMEIALLGRDFSVSYVAQVGSRATPVWVTIASLWSSLDGSLLFWVFILGLWTASLARATRRADPDLAGWSLATMAGVQFFFLWLVLAAGRPFVRMDVIPPDGPGPNPLLQNHVLMAIHPPTLYIGFVGMAAPFSMAVASLLSGRLEADWLRTLRNHSLVVWGFLTIGILLGGWWSYEVLGWGGYWAWDPVENASLLPWLTLTAFFHALLLTERRGQFPGWTLTLVLVSFLLTLLGTFMTRSGVFNSVHSFTQSPIGPVFLAFIALVLLGVAFLLSARLGALERTGAPFTPISREGTFLLHNLVFLVFCCTVLLGTLYPLLNQALTGDQVSVGEPYFEAMGRPLALALVLLMGLGPALPWGRTPPGSLGRRLALPAVAGLLPGLVVIVVSGGTWLPLTVGLAAFSVAVSVQELAAPVRARMRASRRGLADGIATLAGLPRRVGAHVAHVGVAVMAVAIAASSSLEVQDEVTLSPEESVSWQGYTLTYLGEDVAQEGFRVAQRAWFAVRRGERDLGRLAPAMHHYARASQPIGTPAVRSTLGEDLYLSLLRIDPESKAAALRVYREPGVAWLWIGGALVALGGFVAAWPRRRRREVTP
ncbi:MAG: heme lyase CcmF/NrfE family subunit [Deltaproteobacteria bacterium]|nr:heme lyase CcmF/NrfE family subunit [Deltaproteobacteria bacterium]